MLDTISHFDVPSRFVYDVYQHYHESYPSKPSVNGRIFELCVIESLLQAKVRPIYEQAVLDHVPNVQFDILCYDPRFPTVLSCKTSLRERWKQADLEGIALKQVYRQAKSYLVTLNTDEALNVQKKIDEGDVAGLDSCLDAATSKFDDVVIGLSKFVFVEAQPKMPLKGRILGLD